MEIVEISTVETVVIDGQDGGETVVVELTAAIEVIEIVEQGPPGPDLTATFDNDLALLYNIAKL